jgi:hypothetical protein
VDLFGHTSADQYSGQGEAGRPDFCAKDSSGEWSLLLPVWVHEPGPPGLLRIRAHVEPVGLDASGALKALLTATRGTRGKPLGEPRFSGLRGRPEVNGIKAFQFLGDLPPAERSGSEP